jgi:signal transduction histidine kinase
MAIKLIAQAAAEPRRGHRLAPRDLAVLEEEIGRLEELTATFLDFARPAAPETRPVALRPLVEQAVERVRGRAELQGVRVTLDPGGGDGVVEADPNQVRQVVYNLLFNALEAQPAGGWVRAAIGVGGPDGTVALTIADGGPGLPPRLGDQIFEPFVSTKDTGVGLGLSICRRIVSAHNGSLSATGAPGGGAMFTVRLPAADGTDSRSPTVTHLAAVGGPDRCPAS